MQFLQAMQKHRTVALFAYVAADVHAVIGRYPDQVAVVGSMVDLAQTQPVRDDRVTPVFAVGHDVGGVEQSAMTQAAQGTAPCIGIDDMFAKGRLVEAAPGFTGDVTAAR